MKNVLEVEKQGWQALSSGQDKARTFYRSLLADEAVMVFPGGLLIVGKEKILESIGSRPWKTFQFEETHLLSLSDDAAVIIYRVTAQREGGDPYIALISSTYTLREGQWKLALHQQTPV